MGGEASFGAAARSAPIAGANTRRFDWGYTTHSDGAVVGRPTAARRWRRGGPSRGAWRSPFSVVVYLSGRISPGDTEYNFTQAAHAQIRLMRAGYSVVNPARRRGTRGSCRPPRRRGGAQEVRRNSSVVSRCSRLSQRSGCSQVFHGGRSRLTQPGRDSRTTIPSRWI